MVRIYPSHRFQQDCAFLEPSQILARVKGSQFQHRRATRVHRIIGPADWVASNEIRQNARRRRTAHRYPVSTILQKIYMRGKPISDKRIPNRRRSHPMKKTKKSDLSKQAELFFSFNNFPPSTEVVPSYIAAVPVIRTFTTYSVFEAPIPDPRNQKNI